MHILLYPRITSNNKQNTHIKYVIILRASRYVCGVRAKILDDDGDTWVPLSRVFRSSTVAAHTARTEAKNRRER